MVIEKATSREFSVPEYISGEDMSAIFFSARAILDRQFMWRVNQIIQPTPATEETYGWFHNLKPSAHNNRVFRLIFGPNDLSKTVLGQETSLGTQTIFLEDALIEDYETVDSALAWKDGRVVNITFVPLSRVGQYVFGSPPTLPNHAWDQNIRKFIELDGALSRSLMTKYLTSMSRVVPELPPEQMYSLINPETIALLAEEAHAQRTPVDQFLASLLDQHRRVPTPEPATDEQFQSDMASFADDTENLLPYSGTYSRSDIYFDHD
jgi:hypothetical protein